MTVPTPGAAPVAIPTTDTALMLDAAVNLVDLARNDLNDALRALPDDVPLFAVVDLVTALGHLRQAAVLVDKAADVLEIEEARR